MSRVESSYKPWVAKAEPSDLFPYAYEFKLIKSIEELKEVLQPEVSIDYMGFDTETTGLNAEEIDIVGYSFCLDGKTAYYVPVWHFNFGLGEEAIDLIYTKMCNAKTVAMFNMRYDTRVMEYHGYTSLFKEIQELPQDKLLEELNNYKANYEKYNQEHPDYPRACPYNTTEDVREKHKLDLSYRPFIKYNMTKVNTYDVQAVVYLVDTNIKYPSLKSSEEYYLGWRGASFEQTVKNAENPNAVTIKKDSKTGLETIKDMNFFYLTPEEAYEYAAVDALGTYLLGVKLKPYYDEAKTSGVLDVQCLMPLTRFENELTLIDTDRLRQYSNKLDNQIKEIQERCWATAGREFNLGSNKETNEVLKSLNIHTGVTTKNGGMSTSKESIQQCLNKLPPGDPAIQFLTDLTNYGTYTKQKSSYIDNIIEMAENNIHHKNRLRFSYKTTEVPSGRLAAGGDKKNKFFAAANIQNITKPHVTVHYALPEDIVAQYYPEVIEAIDKSGTREEASTPLRYVDIDKLNKLLIENKIKPEDYTIKGNRWSYRIFGWVFSEEPWLIPNVTEYSVEGFIQDLNIRSTFLPDDYHYWVSLDFNAEEIRIPALWSGEPAWVNAFSNNQDVHKSTAVAIWGEENYDKDKRKKAKGANFGILYGMTASNFSKRFNMSYEEAQEFVDQFKNGLPTLFRWIGAMEKRAEQDGTISTMFGRPRRVKSWFDTGEWSWVNFAKRTAINTIVQGTGADILKIVMIRIFELLYNGPNGPLTKIARFKSTIHDEINYQVVKDKEHNYKTFRKIVYQIMRQMRVKLDNWPFPMEVGLSIGNRWGQSVDFEFDHETLEIGGPKKDEASDKDLCVGLHIKYIGDEPDKDPKSDRTDDALRDELKDGDNSLNKNDKRYILNPDDMI